MKKAITLRTAEERNIHLDHAEVHRRLKKKQTATKEREIEIERDD